MTFSGVMSCGGEVELYSKDFHYTVQGKEGVWEGRRDRERRKDIGRV